MGKFEVGDRVEVTYGYGWNGDGIVNRIDDWGNVIVDMNTGDHAGDTGGFNPSQVKHLTTLTIEAGKFYKTRDGRKVGPAEYRDGEGCDAYRWRIDPVDDSGESGHYVYTNAGKYSILGTNAHHDIVAEWVDEQPAKASNDNAEPAKPKFKVGDRVRALVSWGEIEQGKIYTVPHIDEDGDVWFTPNGDGGWNDYLTDNELEHVGTDIAIVALIENGTAKPATRPKVHADQASATTEAERLALQFPGKQFGVFVLANSKIADVVNVPTAVLLAA